MLLLRDIQTVTHEYLELSVSWC